MRKSLGFEWRVSSRRMALITGAFLGLCLALNGQPKAEDQPSNKLGKGDTVLKGDAKCTGCHDDSDNPSPTMLEERPWILSIAKTKHGTVADGRTPTCANCHGESTSHMKKGPDGKRPSPDRAFKKTTPAAKQDEACTSCHKGGKHMFWSSSTHANRGVACVSCHDIHNSGHDKARDKKTQTEVCFGCHKEQRAQMSRPSHHPVPEGKMGCSDCHNPHGAAGDKQLVKDTTNATCFTCHAEKRGPFVHNHAPVQEDCAICHNPHGSINNSLLKARAPYLCQQCHEAASHRGNMPAALAGNLTGETGIGVRLGQGCISCHQPIHGSNNPRSTSSLRN